MQSSRHVRPVAGLVLALYAAPGAAGIEQRAVSCLGDAGSGAVFAAPGGGACRTPAAWVVMHEPTPVGSTAHASSPYVNAPPLAPVDPTGAARPRWTT